MNAAFQNTSMALKQLNLHCNPENLLVPIKKIKIKLPMAPLKCAMMRVVEKSFISSYGLFCARTGVCG